MKTKFYYYPNSLAGQENAIPDLAEPTYFDHYFVRRLDGVVTCTCGLYQEDEYFLSRSHHFGHRNHVTGEREPFRVLWRASEFRDVCAKCSEPLHVGCFGREPGDFDVPRCLKCQASLYEADHQCEFCNAETYGPEHMDQCDLRDWPLGQWRIQMSVFSEILYQIRRIDFSEVQGNLSKIGTLLVSSVTGRAEIYSQTPNFGDLLIPVLEQSSLFLRESSGGLVMDEDGEWGPPPTSKFQLDDEIEQVWGSFYFAPKSQPRPSESVQYEISNDTFSKYSAVHGGKLIEVPLSVYQPS